MNTENKKLSRDKKRKNQTNKAMKLLLNEIKLQKKNKIAQLENELVTIKYKNKLDKDLNKIHVIDKNLHEIKNEVLEDYIGTFEMVGNLKVVDQVKQTHVRYRNMNAFESYINSIDEGYDADDSIFNGYIYKINTPQFKKVNRSQYGNGCDFKHEIIEYQGNN